MSAKADRINQALEREELRYVVDAIDDNPLVDGEVVLWHGGGYPVQSVREALELARRWAAEDEA